MPNKPVAKTNYTKDFLLFFSVPIAIVLIVIGFIYVPRMMANPQYDFVYSVCSEYYCRYSYSIDSSGMVTQQAKSNYLDYDGVSSLKLYDVETDSSKNVSLEEARQYRLNSSSRSKDGYVLTHESSGGGGFLFWGGDSENGWYLKKGIAKQKVGLSTGNYYYLENVKFLGWVE